MFKIKSQLTPLRSSRPCSDQLLVIFVGYQTRVANRKAAESNSNTVNALLSALGTLGQT